MMKERGLDRSAIARLAWTPERREALRQKRLGPLNPMFGKKASEKSNQIRREKMLGNKNPFFGKTHGPDAMAKMVENGKAAKGRAPGLREYLVTDEEYKAQIAAGNRWCCHKKHFVPNENFSRPVGKGGVCRDCDTEYRRKRKLIRLYGVELEWYEDTLAKQNGGCAICGTAVAVKGSNFLAIDHDHETGKARGILCIPCNAAIARLEEVEGWAEKALAYLKSYAASPA